MDAEAIALRAASGFFEARAAIFPRFSAKKSRAQSGEFAFRSGFTSEESIDENPLNLTAIEFQNPGRGAVDATGAQQADRLCGGSAQGRRRAETGSRNGWNGLTLSMRRGN